MENVCLTFDKVTQIDDATHTTTPNFSVDVDLKVIPVTGGGTPTFEFSINPKGSPAKVHYIFESADMSDFISLLNALWQNAG